MKWLLALSLLMYACTQTPAEQPDSFTFLPGEKIAPFEKDEIQEASGLAASIANKDMLWTHNDSGNPPEIFLIDQECEIRLVCKLKDADNRDWEDIAVGPGPDPSTNYIYVADIGDNFAQYPYKIVYRFPEPVLAGQKEKQISIEKYDRIIFRLDTQKDTEALMVHPVSKDLFIISKREEPVVLYRLPFPQSLTDTLTAEKVTTIPLSQVVAAGFSADGNYILMKNYKNVFFWDVREDESIAEVLSRPAMVLPYVEEPQGEAICFARDGSGYFTVSEKAKGEKIFLRFYKKK
ncbi:MAG TPA: hypothetical protein VEB86_05900 [Chryseosolibacter sp.]|nr:hypothetical protein [Chryseosolibacter sp.]